MTDAHPGATELECPICEHRYPRGQLTRHHLVPRSHRGREVVLLCSSCHRQIHAVFSERELARRFDTIPRLLEAEELQGWIRWIRRRRPQRRIRVRKHGRRSRR